MFRCETRCETPPAGIEPVPATFRTKHHRNSAPRYMRWIPEPLQPLFNGKTRLTKQLKPMDEREVARTLRAIGARDDQLFRTLERLPAERKEEIRAAAVRYV